MGNSNGTTIIGPEIVFQNVTKFYDNGVKALDGVSFDIASGEFAFLMGHSGSGKSSLIKTLMLEQKVTEGSITIGGIDIASIPQEKIPFFRRKIGVVFQDFRIIPSKTVYENVAFAMEMRGYKRSKIDEQVRIALDLVGLLDKMHERPGHLSGGEQQRVAIARAFVNLPGLIVADEPTGNLDPKNSEEIISLLEKINAMGATVIVATHEQELVKRHDHRIIYLEHGMRQM